MNANDRFAARKRERNDRYTHARTRTRARALVDDRIYREKGIPPADFRVPFRQIRLFRARGRVGGGNSAGEEGEEEEKRRLALPGVIPRLARCQCQHPLHKCR